VPFIIVTIATVAVYGRTHIRHVEKKELCAETKKTMFIFPSFFFLTQYQNIALFLFSFHANTKESYLILSTRRINKLPM